MKYLGLLIAIVVAVAAAFMVMRFTNNSTPPPEPTQAVQIGQQAPSQVETVDIYIAARDIPIGAIITPNMLTTQPWPKNLVIEGFVDTPEKAQEVVSTITRSSFRRNEPINMTKLVNPDDPNFLAGELPKGMRMVTMGADEIAAVAGFVFPGDRVDVLVTHDILKEGITQKDVEEARNERELVEQVTEALLQDIRVLAVDQRATGGVDEEEGIIIPRSVSIEVTPEDAQRLRLAGEIGELSLALRSIEDKDVIETVAITRKSDLSQSKGLASEEEGKSPFLIGGSKSDDEPVRVIRGTEVEKLEDDE